MKDLLKRLYKIMTHGLLGLVIILPPLLGGVAHADALQINNASAQTQSVINQTIGQQQVASDLNKRSKPRIARQQRDEIAIEAGAVTPVAQAGGTHFSQAADGSMMVMGDNAGDNGFAPISETTASGEEQPAVILLMQATGLPHTQKKHDVVIHINAETIKALKQ